MTRPTHQRPQGTATSLETEASVLNAIKHSEGGKATRLCGAPV